MTGYRQSNLRCGDEPACRVDAGDRASLHADAQNFAILHNIDAAPVSTPRITPHHGIVSRSAAPALQQSAAYGKARIVKIEIGRIAAHAGLVEELRIDAMNAHGIAAPRERVALSIGMIEI